MIKEIPARYIGRISMFWDNIKNFIIIISKEKSGLLFKNPLNS